MHAGSLAVIAGALLAAACSPALRRPDTTALARQVMDTERAFAHTMAARDHAAFVSFLAPDAIFFSGDGVERGAQRIAAAWKPYYAAPLAPFSWQPGQVEVLDSGTLALSTGPVRDARGQLVSRFTSVWRLESPGTWRIVFDKGSRVCAPATP